jgi:electron transfer flavoprotein beta subunit
MNILVCLSNVPDTTTKVKFNGTKLETEGVQWIINPWDELALTRALELKESGAGIDNISVITVGLEDAEPTIRKALAIGADDAYRINSEAFDSFYTAAQIAELAKNIPFDLIMTGFESADYNGVAVGAMLAELLDIPSVGAVSAVNVKDGKWLIDREIDGGKEVLQFDSRVLVSVQKGIAIDPRIPAMRGIMNARRKPLNVSNPVALDSFNEIIAIELPRSKSKVKLFDPEDVQSLLDALRNEAHVL